MDDDKLMTPRQRDVLRAVIGAIERDATDIYDAVCATLDPPPAREDVAAARRILDLEVVRYQPGDRVEAVIGRILDLLEAAAEGEDLEPYPTDDRY
ncbi:MAG: hypothetical protein JWN03_1211 [Nocardia sp.]|uniref:hypothetical protein n=1 Tax=Nocardia sp. TaxID=1821 RepID=UPI0026293BA4|nr:hypothetical protein [Nocardia sp.]MCU1640936.1 hypothetical protein [Nocardia sp.]